MCAQEGGCPNKKRGFKSWRLEAIAVAVSYKLKRSCGKTNLRVVLAELWYNHGKKVIFCAPSGADEVSECHCSAGPLISKLHSCL